MSVIYLCASVYALLFVLIYYSSLKPSLAKEANSKKSLWALSMILIGTFIIRLIVACTVEGHSTDITCFKSWADMVFKDGFSRFYTSDSFTDYPPGYMYVLYVIGTIKALFNLAYDSAVYTLIIKLPAIICDTITGFALYKFLLKRTNTTAALCLPLLYLLNPATIINSSAWGQVDSIFTLFVVLFVWLICEKKLLPACLCFAAGLLIKPQTVIFTPILLLYLYRILFIDAPDKSERVKALKEIIVSALASFALLFVLMIPFAENFDFMPVVTQYIKTLSSYPYASVNAFNVFALFGGNWRDVNQTFLLLPYSAWSNIAIVSIVFVCAFVYIKRKGEANLFMLAAFIIAAMFTFAAKMHERYIFPAMILLLMAFAYKKDIRTIISFAILSIGQFLNTGSMLYQNLELNSTAAPFGAFTPIVCIINVISFIYLAYVMVSEKETIIAPKPKTTKKPSKSSKIQKKPDIMKSSLKMRITRADAIIMSVVTLIYAIVAFTNLGDMKAPVTKWQSPYAGNGIRIEFAENTYIEKMRFFTGSYEERDVVLSVTNPSGAKSRKANTLGSVFCWHEYEINTVVSNITLEADETNTTIHEIAFIDKNGSLITPILITPIGIDGGINALMDEQHLVPEVISYKNGTYFDEIYHARTAYEFINGLTPYENTHPPLGKIFIALGVLIFGMNPFGWRVVGTLFGVLMLPCIYIFAKKLFKNTPAAFAAIMLFALDFMHFAQTRIATIDVYITFFIILMYYFMYDYTTKSFYDTPFNKTLIPLGLSGLCMGLGIASKWTGVYAGIGLAIMFFISFGRRIWEYKKVMSDKQSTKAQRLAVADCKKYCTKTILYCIVFFVIVPAIIYALSYIPFLRAPGMNGIQSIIDNQISMYNYHSYLKDSHPFSSQWYQWPIIARPIWFFAGNATDTTRVSIASFGNPFIWWLGIGALLYCVYRMFKNKNYNALFLIIGYFSQYVPWMGVNRVVFIYHYFTCVPFIVLMLSYVINDAFVRYPYNGITLKNNKATIALCIYLLVCALAFVSFYPVLSGMEVSVSYIDSLKWYQSWVF